MRPGEPDVHTLVGAYAMDAVGDADRAVFDDHLADCQDCRDEIRELREATARLAAAAAVVPRPVLKARALQAIARTRQLPPLTGPTGPPLAGSLAGSLAGRRSARPAGSDGRRRFPGGYRRLGPARRMVTLLAATAAVVLIAAGVAIGMLARRGAPRPDLAQRRVMAIARVLNAPDAARLTGLVRTGGTATVVMSHSRRSLVFTAAGLAKLPAIRRYELWLMSPSGDRPAGMLAAARGGLVSPMVVSGLTAGDRIGMTIEPATGSARPTTRPVLLLSLRTR